MILGMAAAALLLPSKTSAQCVTASVGGSWVNTASTSQTGTFTATFDATPTASPTNSVVGLSNGAQTAYANFACMVRFNPTGSIDARNGGAYAAASTIPYSAGVSYHFRLAVNIGAQTYSIFVTPSGGSELTVGTNYAFRIAASTLNYWGVFVDAAASGGAGSVTVCNFAIGAGGGGSSLTGTSTDGFHSLAMSSAQSGSFTATFDATPSISPENAVVALSNGAATAYTGYSCIARFNPTGQIDAYNGTAYAAASTINYSAGISYHFRMVVSVSANTYSVYVTPAGGSELTVGLNYAFRAAQTSLNTWDLDVNATPAGASLTASNLSVTGSGGGGTAATPSFSPAAGTYSSAQSVSILTITGGASIRYTTDGSTPSSTAGTLYSGPVNISSTTTVKAIAFASGFTNSTVASATYTISGGLNPNLPPGENFNLTDWDLMLPTGSAGSPTVISQPQLKTYTDSHFSTDKTDGAMTFFVPENGVHSTNSSYPRSELHNLNNAGGGDWPRSGTHTLQATLKVKDTVGTVTIGQIHLSNPGKPLLELQCHTNGQVSAFIEINPDGTNTPPATTITTVPLGTKFSYTIQVHNNNQLTITVAGVTKTFTINSSYNSSTFYFKAGAYLQTTGSSSTVGAHVAFYSLQATN